MGNVSRVSSTACATILIALTAACGPPLGNRFEADTGCTERISKTHLGAGLWEVRGCGRRLRYICDNYGTCVREGQASSSGGSTSTAPRRAAPVVNPSPPRLPQGVAVGESDDGTRGVRLVLNDPRTTVILLAVPGRDPDTARLEVESRTTRPIDDSCDSYWVRSSRDRAAVAPDDPTVAVASLRAIAERTFLFDFCGRQLRATDAQRRLLGRFVAKVDELAEEERESPATPPHDGEPIVEAAIRARIEARSNAIRACIGNDPAAIHARWTATGAVTVAVASLEASDPKQGCVRAAFGELVVEGGRAGELLHPIAD